MARKAKSFWEVKVGNIGRVFDSDAKDAEQQARNKYSAYVTASKMGEGRASGENVTLWRDNEVVEEWPGGMERVSDTYMRIRVTRFRVIVSTDMFKDDEDPHASMMAYAIDYVSANISDPALEVDWEAEADRDVSGDAVVIVTRRVRVPDKP